jgi:hypothetical protein
MYQRAVAKTPLVSIGLLVFNAESQVEESIRSVLSQSMDDFELIIHDNASGDRTAEICRGRAAREPRIRYFRNSRNVGFHNYNLAFRRCRGRYFKWLAQDDRLLPTYLESTVAVLEKRAEVVLCNSLISRIDPSGTALGVHDSGLNRADVPSAAQRLMWVAKGLQSSADFYGLIRTESLRSSMLHGGFPGAQRALLAQLALRGRLVQLPAPLLEMRQYPLRSECWQEEGLVPLDRRLRRRYLRMLGDESLPLTERARCYAVLAQWWGQRWLAAHPRIKAAASRVRRVPGAASLPEAGGATEAEALAERRR